MKTALTRGHARISIPAVVLLAAAAALVGREAGAQFVAPQLVPQLGTTVAPQLPVTRPTVSGVVTKCNGIAMHAPAFVRGLNFGTSPNGRKVKLVKPGATVYPRIDRWTSSEITIGFTNDAPGGTLGIADANGAWVSNTVSIRIVDLPGGTDSDGDSHDAITAGGDDCDDCDVRRYPQNTEICDEAGHDEDCDPATFGRRDADGDRYQDARCFNEFGGRRYSGNDCDDARSDINPVLPEVCNGYDDNCDGAIDDPIGRVLYRDGDRDGAGDPRTQQRSCGGLPGYVERGGDCNDADPAIRPGQGCPATCN